MSKTFGKTFGHGKHKIACSNRTDPPFIKKFKESIGYKEGPSLSDKVMIREIEDREEADKFEDEKPTVVVLKKGDLTLEEAEAAEKDLKLHEVPADGKVTFKKPEKQIKNENELNHSSKRKAKQESETRAKKDELLSKTKKINNKTLLSFDDEDDES